MQKQTSAGVRPSIMCYTKWQ